MKYQIRPVDLAQDVAAVSALFGYVEPEPPNAEELARSWSKVPEGGIRHRLAAVDAAGTIFGYAVAGHDPWDKEGRWFGRLVVAPDYRRHGVASGLFAGTVGRLGEGARVFQGEVRENDEDGQVWALHRGFRIDRHIFESVLELPAFDEAPLAGVVPAAEAGGIRFFSRADDPSEATARKIHELLGRTILDIPGVNLARTSTFEEWRVWALDEQEIPRDCFILAADGDRIVGATILETRSNGALYTGHTSVDREYRGRKLALALKLLSIRVAKRREAPYMRTNNDSLNAPMLAVNRKLGYRPEPGVYVMEKFL